MTRAHDENGPSVLHRRMLCPGSTNAERGLADESTEAGERGTLGHAWGAHVLRPDEFPAPAEPLTDAEFQAVAFYVGTVRAMSPTDTATLLVEHRVRLEEIGIIEGGSIDAAWIDTNARLGVVFDFKSGHVPARHPKWNWQTLAYAIGLLTAYGLDSVDAVIVQPALDEEHRVRVARFTRSDLWQAGMAIEDAITATRDPAAPRIPGGEQCEYCRARGNCLARIDAVTATEVHTALSNADAVRAMSPATRGYWWPRIVEGRKRLEEIEALFAATVLEHGLPVDGWTIAPGKRGSRKWTSPDAALATGRGIALDRGIDPDSLSELRVKSPAEFDAILGKSQPVREKLAEFITQTEGGLRLVQQEGAP